MRWLAVAWPSMQWPRSSAGPRRRARRGGRPRSRVPRSSATATPRFWPDEWDGFRAAIESRAQRYDLLALEAQNAVRLITTSKYPPLRGTRFTIGDLDYLYTTGYIAALGEFHGMHVPAPLQVADHVGQDTPREVLLKEVLALTKLNWNSAALGGLLPVTIKFSRLVGQIM
jgi:hypothetical protein